MQVHFKGWRASFDEIIPMTSDRCAVRGVVCSARCAVRGVVCSARCAVRGAR
jgi:hypothetical protein